MLEKRNRKKRVRNHGCIKITGYSVEGSARFILTEAALWYMKPKKAQFLGIKLS